METHDKKISQEQCEQTSKTLNECDLRSMLEIAYLMSDRSIEDFMKILSIIDGVKEIRYLFREDKA